MTISRFTIPDKPPQEEARLEAIAAIPFDYDARDPELTRIVAEVADQFGVPIALVSIVGEDAQCFAARIGLDAGSTPRSISFCGHAILASETLLVEDARIDPRFAGNPLVIGPPHIRFYAGTPLTIGEGHAIGTLCIIDSEPHDAATVDVAQLEQRGREVVARLEAMRSGGGA